jgi:hypothetical protein
MAGAPLAWAEVANAPQRKGNWMDTDGMMATLSPLVLACAGGQETTVGLLLSPGYKAQALISAALARRAGDSGRWRNGNGMLPIHHASTVKIVQLLLACDMTEEEIQSFRLADEAGAGDSSSDGEDEHSVDDDAAEDGTFVRDNVGVDARDNSGRSPLHTASSPEVAFALLAAGADPWAADISDEYPADAHAMRADHERQLRQQSYMEACDDASHADDDDGSSIGKRIKLNTEGGRDRMLTMVLHHASVAAAIDAWTEAEEALLPTQQLAWARAAVDETVPIPADLVEMVAERLRLPSRLRALPAEDESLHAEFPWLRRVEDEHLHRRPVELEARA